MNKYTEVYEHWQADPEGFWEGAASRLIRKSGDRNQPDQVGPRGRWM